jgi:hypothetical protein
VNARFGEEEEGVIVDTDSPDPDVDTESDEDACYDPDSLLPGENTPEMLFKFTRDSHPTYVDCERIMAYFDTLMQEVDKSECPTTAHIIISKLVDHEFGWWKLLRQPTH